MTFSLISVGTGGQEASLFTKMIYEMYEKYAVAMGWQFRTLSEQEDENLGGALREASAEISSGHMGDKEEKKIAPSVYSCLKFESGTHRVQRVPTTDSQGRIHTSTMTVAVIPQHGNLKGEASHAVQIHENDIKFETFRSSGPGGTQRTEDFIPAY
jgi:peptide chain release factor 1